MDHTEAVKELNESIDDVNYYFREAKVDVVYPLNLETEMITVGRLRRIRRDVIDREKLVKDELSDGKVEELKEAKKRVISITKEMEESLNES